MGLKTLYFVLSYKLVLLHTFNISFINIAFTWLIVYAWNLNFTTMYLYLKNKIQLLIDLFFICYFIRAGGSKKIIYEYIPSGFNWITFC